MFRKTRYKSRDTKGHRQHLQLHTKINSPISPKKRAGIVSNAIRSITRDAPEL